MAFLRGLPPDVLIAGWPVGPMVQSIPYMIGRPMLLTYETHQTFHEEYTLAMRDRFFALNDAYFARDVKPLVRLRDEFGVTHLLLLRDYYRKRPWYFEPFVPWIKKRFAELDRQTPEPLRQIPRAGVYDDEEGWVLLDLRKLDERPATQPVGPVDPSPIGVRPR
jgi:hypothetical protein